MPNIEVEDLYFAYERERDVLSGITFQAGSGETVGIIGANGAGKSTLLKLFVGLLSGYRGALRINRLKVEKKTLPKIRKMTGYVFQDSDSQLFLSTVYEDVAFGPRNYGYTEEEVKKRVMDSLKKVHLEDKMEQQIYRLSGGQKKLASIATVLSLEPDILLLDEPSIALDPGNRRNLIHIINKIQALKVIASHDLDMIYDTCERTILLADGKIIKDGETGKILTDRKLLKENGLELPLSLLRR